MYKVHHNGESIYDTGSTVEKIKESKMEEYSLGPDELPSYEQKVLRTLDLKWFVYYYEIGSYEGWGDGIGLTEDDRLLKWNFGHCSCYGPLDGGPEEISLSNFMSDKVVCDESAYEAVNKKVRELLCNENRI